MAKSPKGHGTLSNPPGRFNRTWVERLSDGWYTEEEESNKIPEFLEPDHARSIITTNDSPDVPFDYSINPYRGCAHACPYCIHGDTPILMGDGTARAIESLRVGDEIYGTVRQGWYLRYVKTRVLAHWCVVKPAYRITLANGTELIASGDHRFLTEGGWKFVTGTMGASDIQRPYLTANNKLMGTGTFEAPPEKDFAYRKGYLCGLIRADEVVKSAARLEVVSVEPLHGAMRLYDITTGTGDFIANGVVSHNCYARPSHSYLGLSPGLDFETRLFYKENAAQLLEVELARPGYVCKPIALGTNTDPYQPVERRLRVTRSILEVLARCRHPVTIVTKGALVLRDLDLLTDLARDGLVNVALSITTLDAELKRVLEPRAASPQARLRAVRELAAAGVPTGVMVAPVIPALTDHELEAIVDAGAEAGACWAAYVVLRLPYEVKDLFREWLAEHYPDRVGHVMSIVQSLRGGRDNDPRFGSRMLGAGPFAQLLRARFELACRRRGLGGERVVPPSSAHFLPPKPHTDQLSLDL